MLNMGEMYLMLEVGSGKESTLSRAIYQLLTRNVIQEGSLPTRSSYACPVMIILSLFYYCYRIQLPVIGAYLCLRGRFLGVPIEESQVE